MSASQGLPGLATDRHALDRTLVVGIGWTGAGKWGSQALSWAATLVVARLLSPTDYGLVGMATVYLGLVELMSEFGLSTAIVQRRDLSDAQLEQLAGLSAMLGVCFLVVSTALAAPVATFFGEQAVAWIIIALSFRFVTSGVQMLPRALLVRSLHFRTLATIEGLEALLAAVSTLALALFGFRYWALVLGALVAGLVGATLSLLWSPTRFAWPRDWPSLSSVLALGRNVVGSRVAWYVYSASDFAIVGRVLGKTALGAYTFGWILAAIPVDRLSAVIGRVTPAVFSAVQKESDALRRYVCGLSEGLALVTFPVSVGLALVADEFIILVLGPPWQSAIQPLRLLALSAAFRSLSALYPQVLVATGQSRREMQFAVITAAVLPVLFYFGTRWGTVGVASAWLVGHPVLVISLHMRSVFRSVGLRASVYLKALWPALSGTMVMVVVVLAVRSGLPTGWPAGVRLTVLVTAGGLAYTASLLTAHRARARVFLSLLRSAMSP